MKKNIYNVSIIYQYCDGHKVLRHENGYDYFPDVHRIRKRRRSAGITVYKMFVFKVK